MDVHENHRMMCKTVQTNLSGWVAPFLVVCWLCQCVAQAAGPDTNPAALLRSRYAELEQQLSHNQFKRPLYLDSVESSGYLRGDIYALVDYPFAAVNQALHDPTHWCDVLILHINTKYCHAMTTQADSILVVRIGKKDYQRVDQAQRVEFEYRAVATTREYFDIGLSAKTGPMGTSDYRVRLEALSLQGDRTFLHITYSYAYNLVARIAMQAYLATIARDKVGFTRTARQSDSASDYIGGVRGVVERNTMRYYLAIDAYLGSLSAAPAQQLEQRLQSWFTATELYPRQLRELDRATYLDMKRREYLRQQTPP